MRMLRLMSALVCCTVLAACSATETPVRKFPVPDTVSPELRELIAMEPFPYWNEHPQTNAEWHDFAQRFASRAIEALPYLRESLGVNVSPDRLGGVPIFVIEPRQIPAEHAGKTLLHFHGGGYVLNPGEAGTPEAMMMASFGGYRVISVDYRMAPDFPYPAAMDDAVAVYRELLKSTPPENIGVFGTSTGGGMTLSLALRLREEGLPLPAALAAGTPWTDLTKTGDTYFTNEGVDNVLVSYDGWLGGAARLYAGGTDLKNPFLSPVYGDVRGFPPTLLTSGTRDLFLSNTVRMHLKLLEANVPAELIVFEGMSHANYHMNINAPETAFHFRQVARFFEQYMP